MTFKELKNWCQEGKGSAMNCNEEKHIYKKGMIKVHGRSFEILLPEFLIYDF